MKWVAYDACQFIQTKHTIFLSLFKTKPNQTNSHSCLQGSHSTKKSDNSIPQTNCFQMTVLDHCILESTPEPENSKPSFLEDPHYLC